MAWFDAGTLVLGPPTALDLAGSQSAVALRPVTLVNAVGIAILTGRIDIANARIQFEDGCVANVTASRVSTEKIRKLRLFQARQYLSLDYTRQDIAVFTLEGNAQSGVPRIAHKTVAAERREPLRDERSCPE